MEFKTNPLPCKGDSWQGSTLADHKLQTHPEPEAATGMSRDCHVS